MKTKHKKRDRSISRCVRLAVLLLAGLFAGLPATAALAAEPTTPSEARARAEHYRERADHLRSMGGQAYKTGLVQSAEMDAAKYEALARKLESPGVGTPTAPELAPCWPSGGLSPLAGCKP